ncbi:MAG: TonB family protein [Burkholderiales bacterium]|nr:TonB family protein [Burkholderiales bacterium]
MNAAAMLGRPLDADARRWRLSFGLAFLAELSLAGALWWLGQQVTLPPPPPMQIELAPPAQPAPTPPVPKPPRPHPVQHHPPRSVPLPQPQQVAPPTPVSLSKPAMPVAAVKPPQPAPVKLQPLAPVKPPPPAPAQPDSAAVKLSFEAQLRDAIQSAVRFPEAARLMRLSGRAQIGFDWKDGYISHLHIVRSSGVDILDKAALHTVQIAPSPPTPPQFSGRAMAFEVWVDFTLHDD